MGLISGERGENCASRKKYYIFPPIPKGGGAAPNSHFSYIKTRVSRGV